MTSSFSDKPFSPRREPRVDEPERVEDPEEPPPAPQLRREPGMRINYRRLLAGLALLFLITGALLICFVDGGLLNPKRRWDGVRYIVLDEAGHIIGFVLLGVGALLFVFLFSLEKRP